jgi:hypothetical protein
MTRNSPVSGCRVFLSFNPRVGTPANLSRVLRYAHKIGHLPRGVKIFLDGNRVDPAPLNESTP